MTFVIRITGKDGGVSYLALGGIEGPKDRAYGYRDAETAKQAGAHHQRRWGSANVTYDVESRDDIQQHPSRLGDQSNA
jgi:hypothetical protein